MAETEGEPQGDAASPHQPAPPAGAPLPPSGPPIFVNPDDLTAQGHAAPTFVTKDGTPVGGPGAPHPHVAAQGAPVFLNADGTVAGPPAPAPQQAQPQPFGTLGQAPGSTALPGIPGNTPPGVPGAPTFTVAGGQPGGPVFVKQAEADVSLDSADRPWSWWVGPVAVLLAFVVVLFLGVFIAIAVEAGGGDTTTAFDDNTHWLGLAQDVLWVAVALLVPFMAVRYLRPEQLGLQGRPLGRSIAVLVGCLVLFYVLAAVYAGVFDVNQNDNTLLDDTGIGETVGRDVLFALLFTVAAPVAEELLFRGLLFRSLRDGFSAKFGSKQGIAAGALLSGVIFGGIHVGGGQNAFLPVLMMLGVLLALAYQWSGTLYVPVVIHSINNAAATGFNSDPAADWIYVLIALGPVISILVLLGITRFIRVTFPQERPDPPVPPAAPPTGTPPQFFTSGGPANL